MTKETLLLIIGFLFIHWVADFVLQTDWQATNKSKSNRALTAHVFNYSLVWFVTGTIASIILEIYFQHKNSWWNVFYFTGITFACHWLTDYFTSRLNSKLWADQKVHLFFVSVGFDQILHYVQLFGTYYILIQ